MKTKKTEVIGVGKMMNLETSTIVEDHKPPKLPPSETLHQTCEKAGFTVREFTLKLIELVNAKEYRVAQGKRISKPAYNVQLKALEILGKYLLEPSRTNNHLHIHGAKIDGLFDKTRTDQGEGQN